MKKITVITGAPGAGKTTRFIEGYAKKYPDKKVWVAEPVQTIVEEKRQSLEILKDGELVNLNIEFINYSRAFSNDFWKEAKNDILIVDEVQNIFFSGYRNLDIGTLDEVCKLWNEEVFLITATPKILEIYLRGFGISYNLRDYGMRLERKKIRVNIIPVRFFQFLNSENISGYDIISTNSIRNLKKIEKYFLPEDRSGYSFIYSNNSESNILLFGRREFKDDRWIGTISLGQGINKWNTLTERQGRILFDGNSFGDMPDFVRDKFRSKRSRGLESYKRVVSISMIESLIQLDRFRNDLDILETDFLLNVDLEEIPLVKGLLEEYLREVYVRSDIEIVVGNGLYSGKIPRFSIDFFKEGLEGYDIRHENNSKNVRERFLELVDDWVNPMEGDDDRIKPPGNYKNSLIYFRLLVDKFEKEGGEDIGWIFYDGVLELSKRCPVFMGGLKGFIEYLMEKDIKKIGEDYYRNKGGDDEGKGEQDIKDIMYSQLDYLGESLLQILLGHFGISYNTSSEIKGRGGNPLQLISRAFRKLLIVKDIDIKGCHVVGMIKKVIGEDVEVRDEDIEKLYSYETVGRANVLDYMRTFSKDKGLSDGDIEEKYKGERGVCKNALLWAINRGGRYGKKEDLDYVKRVMSSVYSRFEDINLEDFGDIGYGNGIIYEGRWLGDWNGARGVIFRVADGLCQVYGNEGVIDEIRDKISKGFGVPVSVENIEKYDDLGLEYNLDYFIKKGNASNIYEVLDVLEEFRKYIRKGKGMKEKKYIVREDLLVKKTGVCYEAGVYNWVKVPADIPESYRRRFIRKVK